jgi:hypothetical protein
VTAAVPPRPTSWGVAGTARSPFNCPEDFYFPWGSVITFITFRLTFQLVRQPVRRTFSEGGSAKRDGGAGSPAFSGEPKPPES